MRCSQCVIVSLLVTGVACGPMDPPAPFTRADSAGVTLVTYATSVAAAAGTALQLDDAPVTTIGGDDLALYRVHMARFLSGGGIAVLNRGAQELLVFDSAGAFTARAGGEGGGPGEFRRLLFLSVGPGDSLVAYDDRIGQVSVFDRRGTFARIVTLMGADTLGRVRNVGVLPSGTLVGAWSPRSRGAGLVQDSLVVVRFTPSGAPDGTVGVYPHMYVHWGPHDHPGGGKAAFPAPVALSSLTAVSVGDAVYVGLADRFELLRIGTDGARRVTRQREPPVPLTAEHRDQFFATLAARGRAGPEEEILKRLEGPTTLPTFGDEPLTASYDETLVLTDAGGVWVKPFRLTDSADAEWLRFSADGLYEGTVTVPAAFRPTAVRGDRVLGVWRDAMDVESVRVFRVSAAGPAPS